MNRAGLDRRDSTHGSHGTHGVFTGCCHGTEKLDIFIITPYEPNSSTMEPSPTNRKYNELTEKQKRAVLGACLSHRVDGVLPRGSYATIARNLLVSRRAVGRLWKSAHSTRANGIVATPEVKSNKGHKEHRVWLSHMLVMNEILKDYGGNNFRIPHMKKEQLERNNMLPWILTVDRAAMEALQGHGWQPPTEDHSIQGTVNGRVVRRVAV